MWNIYIYLTYYNIWLQNTIFILLSCDIHFITFAVIRYVVIQEIWSWCLGLAKVEQRGPFLKFYIIQ